jgi:hypothetical protein
MHRCVPRPSIGQWSSTKQDHLASLLVKIQLTKHVHLAETNGHHQKVSSGNTFIAPRLLMFGPFLVAAP